MDGARARACVDNEIRRPDWFSITRRPANHETWISFSKNKNKQTEAREREEEKKRNRNATADWFSFFSNTSAATNQRTAETADLIKSLMDFLLINDGHGSNGRLNEFVFSPFLLFTVFASDRKK